jgi:NTP pyrophosphatase (non-canonical NTP hydrolase)
MSIWPQSVEEINHEHAKMVKTLIKPGKAIHTTLSTPQLELVHDALGIAGEAGELVDAIKKYVIYNKELDIENVIEELGDLEFYMQDLREKLGITREKTLLHNMEKLSKRYKDFQYSDQQAQDRADKA